jgi:hypothetical protein
MVVAKKPRKPLAKRVSAPKNVAAKKTESKANATDPSPSGNNPKASEYAVGDQVSHPMFGSGTVAEVEADKLTIEFAKGVTKQIIDYYVRPRKA